MVRFLAQKAHVRKSPGSESIFKGNFGQRWRCSRVISLCQNSKVYRFRHQINFAPLVTLVQVHSPLN